MYWFGICLTCAVDLPLNASLKEDYPLVVNEDLAGVLTVGALPISLKFMIMVEFLFMLKAFNGVSLCSTSPEQIRLCFGAEIPVAYWAFSLRSETRSECRTHKILVFLKMVFKKIWKHGSRI